jgi:hypothetical protein
MFRFTGARRDCLRNFTPSLAARAPGPDCAFGSSPGRRRRRLERAPLCRRPCLRRRARLRAEETARRAVACDRARRRRARAAAQSTSSAFHSRARESGGRATAARPLTRGSVQRRRCLRRRARLRAEAKTRYAVAPRRRACAESAGATRAWAAAKTTLLLYGRATARWTSVRCWCTRDVSKVQSPDERVQGAHLPQAAEVEVSEVRQGQDAEAEVNPEHPFARRELAGCLQGKPGR